MNRHYDYVLDHLDEREILEQLAEEAAELSQAALKLIRAKQLSNNPTPVQECAAVFKLQEEAIDTVMCLMLFGMNPEWLVDSAEKSYKWERWAERIRSHLEGMKKHGSVQNK